MRGHHGSTLGEAFNRISTIRLSASYSHGGHSPLCGHPVTQPLAAPSLRDPAMTPVSPPRPF